MFWCPMDLMQTFVHISVINLSQFFKGRLHLSPPFPSSSPLLSTNYVTLPDLTSAVPPLADINSHLRAGVCKGQFGKGQIQAPENLSVSPPVFECCVLLSVQWMTLMLHLELNMVLKITQNVTAVWRNYFYWLFRLFWLDLSKNSKWGLNKSEFFNSDKK